MKSMETIENHLKNIKIKYSFDDIQIIYNERNFGNMFININDKNGIVMNFISDRNECRVEIGTRKEMYLLQDVLEVLQIDDSIGGDDLLTLVDRFLQIYDRENTKFLKAFSSATRKLTRSRIKKIEKMRSESFFKE